MMRPMEVILTAYLLGSIPFGYLIVRAIAGVDVRGTGSGGTGATNVSRRAGKVAGVITLLLDAAKGALAVLIAWALLGSGSQKAVASVGNFGPWMNSQVWVALAAVLVIVGHCFPVWLRFRGGKGVATGAGVFLCLAPIPLGFAGVLFALTVWLTRYVSLGSMLAALSVPAFICLQNGLVKPIAGFPYVLSAAVLSAVLIFIMHRANMSGC